MKLNGKVIMDNISMYTLNNENNALNGYYGPRRACTIKTNIKVKKNDVLEVYGMVAAWDNLKCAFTFVDKIINHLSFKYTYIHTEYIDEIVPFGEYMEVVRDYTVPYSGYLYKIIITKNTRNPFGVGLYNAYGITISHNENNILSSDGYREGILYNLGRIYTFKGERRQGNSVNMSYTIMEKVKRNDRIRLAVELANMYVPFLPNPYNPTMSVIFVYLR